VSDTRDLGFGGKVAVALGLTLVGGYVDAVGYIALYQVFTANMSGNSVHVGIYLGQLNWMDMARPFCAVAAYVTGMAVTRIAVEVAGRSGLKRIASYTFAVEAALLAVFAHARPAMHFGQIVNQQSPAYFGMVALLAFAMGVQTATLTHVGPLTVYTTFVTGTLTKLTESFTRVLFWAYDHIRGRGADEIATHAISQPDVREAAMLASTWVFYVAGAALGTVMKERWELRALYIPVALLVVFILLDQIRPVGVEEEKHQTGLSGG
jgi:uncharacterized membrane protein YoaK (UPF0700 family)